VCFLLVAGTAVLYFNQMEFVTVTASIVVVRCFVDVTSVKFLAPQLYLQQIHHTQNDTSNISNGTILRVLCYEQDLEY